MTLKDIFYQHTEWWNNPSLGKDTQGKYAEVIKEMEVCAADYAKDIKGVGDKWKWVIVNETRELCRNNRYSYFLTGEKKEWHDTVVSDFLLYIKKAMKHYGFDFKELPRNIQALYGIEYFGNFKAPEPQQIPKELTTPEAKEYFNKAIELGLMNSNYQWLKGLQMLACFAREMSIKLKMGKGDRIAWKPFETLFKVKHGKLRSNYNDIQKTGESPKKVYLIDEVFE